ncbi:DEAD/DEAH box helicase [Clostridium sp.]|uniref:DEAD/DEAH box helicase n=1 Tax=Clostridium sp. TaxID=1506 RepID=UPI002FC5FE7F
MINENFVGGFNKSVTTRKVKDGIRILENDLVEKIDYSYNSQISELFIESSVISEDLYSKYLSCIVFNTNNFEVINTKCTCRDFENNELSKKNYACKHVCATFYRFLEKLSDDINLQKDLKNNTVTGINKLLEIKKSINILDTLLKDDLKEELRFDVYINRNTWSHKISAEFKIGINNIRSSKMYTLKDLELFLVNKYNNIPITYGKDFTFDNSKQKFNYKDIRLLNFIDMLKNIDINSKNFKKSQDKHVNGKEIYIPKGMLRTFFEIVKDHRIFLNNGFYSRMVQSEIIEGEIPLPIEISEKNNNIKLKMPRGVPEDLSDNGDVFLYDTVVYLPPMEQCDRLSPYIKTFIKNDEVTFLESQKERVYRELIPSLSKISNSVLIDNSISKNIINVPVKFKFYFDRDKFIFLKVNVLYGEYEFNIFDDIREKIIYRDIHNENKIMNKLKNLGIHKLDTKVFAFVRDDDYIFDFFKNKIIELQEIGDVFYSENFKGLLSLNKENFNVEVRKGKNEYFEFKYSISDIEEDEFYNILRSFRDNKKYYKLENGEFIDLEEIESKEILRLIDLLSEEQTNTNQLEFSKGKAIYTNSKLKEIIGDYKGKDILENISNKLQLETGTDTIIPKDLNAKLRDYQIYGLKWFKELSTLGFGGILGDEMGLGKTLQAISFILSNRGKKTIIIAPTSLIYNWRDEFSKFAPNLKIGITNDIKKKRLEIINNSDDYDVIITTYNLFRIDNEFYNSIEFDYCFLDEAQYIKNPTSKNSKACKKIKAKNRFALTGTPIENNLMELWSIFDFIMPGFLNSKEKFNSRYNRCLDEDKVIISELRTLISPFILRRLKKEVLSELPEKIEKTITVDMTKEQKKVYASYAKHVKDIIENKVKNNEFSSSKIEILSYITKLRQISLDPSIVMNDYKGDSGKLIALSELLTDMIDRGHKVLVFSQFTSVLGKIKDVLDSNNLTYYYLDGSVKSSKRQELVNKFNSDDTNIFLISLKAGGTGLNLTSADVVIHFDPWWNPAVEEQATDRAHRIGQKNVVEVIKLVSEGTVEEKIIQLQGRKKELIENLIGEGSLENSLFSKLSEQNILDLFNRN